MENFVRRFEYVVGKTPDKTALVCGDDRLTYRQLDELSSKIAARLIRNGAEKEKIYPIVLRRSNLYIGAIIGKRQGLAFITSLNLPRTSRQGGGERKGKQSATPKILDTSVIIDGRILDIMETGFLEGPIVIPEFVLVELRHISDSSDSLKRNRGRRGLDVLNKIRDDYGVEIYDTNGDKSLEEIPEVDVKLLKLAQRMDGKVVTNDYNLNKVAGIKGVEVLNINELANALKPVVLPGEKMNLFLVKEGKENAQALAYLDDGTMIVAEDGRRMIGKTAKIRVTSVLQTSAGRMIFAKPAR